MKKDEVLARWRAMTEDRPILPHMTPITYGSSGSSYGACGIRIDGNPRFVDAVMSRLRDLVDGENAITRLELSRQTVKPRPGRPLEKCDKGAEVCYIRLHERGGDAMVMNAYSPDMMAAARRYADAVEA